MVGRWVGGVVLGMEASTSTWYRVCVCLVYVLSTTLYLFMFPFIYLCAFVGWLSVGNVRVELLNIYR